MEFSMNPTKESVSMFKDLLLHFLSYRIQVPA